MKTNSVSRCASLCLIAVLAAASAAARTVYDAGKAFNEAGHNANVFGPWSLLHASGEAMTNSEAFDTTTGSSGSFAGIGGSSSPWIRVNTGSTSVQSGEEVLPNELLVHPADPKGGTVSHPSDVVRFTVPETGWYSANIFAHDTAKEANNASTTNSGVQVSVRAKGNVIARQIVSLEGYLANSPTRRFDFQMPAQHLAAGDKIEVVIGNKYNAWSAHSSDTTGLRFTVTKEDEGTFYDSGIAMLNNVAASPYANPYGTIADGTWYFLGATAPAAQTAPENISLAATSRITTEATSTYLRGVARTSGGSSPFVLVNTSSALQSTAVAPGELKVHPYAGDSTLKTWTVVRFRPPESGRYSASIVVRDVDRANLTQYPSADGTDVYLYVADTLVTNAYVSLETPVACSAHFTFEDRFLVAGEPVDIVVSPHGQINNDATGVSAIFRREPGAIYDAGKSFYADRQNANTGYVFNDLLGGGAQWMIGAKTNAWCGAQFYEELIAGQVASGAKAKWWMQGRFTAYDQYPYFVMATNGTAIVDQTFGFTADLLAAAPQEFVAVVNDPGYQSSSPTLKATVPSNGVYRVRACARDLNNGGGDGVQASVVANGYIAATSPVKRDSGGTIYEAVLGADRLWLKSGERIEYVVDPLTSRNCDPTGLSACYEKTDDATSHVVNIDFGVPGSVTGRFSNHTGAGREGWSNWNKWNALRIGSSSTLAFAENCWEADGSTKRNVTVALTRGSGAVKSGSASGMPTGSALYGNWVESDSASDAYTFTLSKLKANESYTLYLYSAKGGAEGNASFTVGGVTKQAEETWNLEDTKVLARFDVVSDSNGEISGTFAAADANGGAFNGLTIVGEFPEYDPPGMLILVK